MNRLIGWFFDLVMKPKVSAFMEDINRPFAAQERQLRTILSAAANTQFGKAHDFARISTLSGVELFKAWRSALPIRSYADHAADIEKMKNGEPDILVPGKPQMFALTSGTTGDPKFCPVTEAFIQEHHRQHLLWMYDVYKSHPAVIGGTYLTVVSPAEIGRTAGGIPYGAMSGRQLETQSIPVRRRQAAPAALQHLADPEERWTALLLFAAAHANLSVVTAVNPSSLVALASRLTRDSEKIAHWMEHGYPTDHEKDDPARAAVARLFRPNAARARKLREIIKTDGSLHPATVWPNLAVLLTWQGGSARYYLPHVSAQWGDVPQRCLGLRASEGTFTIPMEDFSPSGALAVGGHVMEFVHADEDITPTTKTLLANQLEKGALYRLVATTSGGLYRYDTGDLVRMTGFAQNTPKMAFERRAGAVLSATGEKVTETQVTDAMEAATADGPLLNGFTLTYEIDDDATRYVLAVECTGGAELARSKVNSLLRDRLVRLGVLFDQELRQRNVEYDGKRADGRLAAPRVILLADKSYDYYRADRAAEGKPEAQIKIPVLVAPPGPGRCPVWGCSFFERLSIAEEF